MSAGVDVTTVDVCDSTNGVLLARARAGGIDRPTVLRALAQTAGRGRLGRSWHMEPGASLAFSIAWPLRRAPEALSLAVGVALADALEPGDAAPCRIRLKWPNDLWLDGPRKLAGILVEVVSGVAVVGVGLNVRPLRLSDVASLAELDPAATADGTFARLWPRLVGALGRFDREGFAADVARRFDARDGLRGTPVRATVSGGRSDDRSDDRRGGRTEGRADGVAEGLADGVEADGALRLRTAVGIARVTSGEVLLLRPVRASDGAAAC